MNKFLFLLLFVAVSLGYMFNIDKLITKNFNPFNSIKGFYIKNETFIQNSIEKYFNQINRINELEKKNNELENYKLLYKVSNEKLNTLINTINIPHPTTSKIKLVRVLSYVDFDNLTKVWLDMPKKNSKILGLISNGYAAGIVVNDNNRAKALLNGNEKANYSIFIGNSEAPGIIHGSKNKRNLIAKYIPIWYKIKKGDEVITSGMDNIFFEGLKVGKVISIKKMQDMQEATISPHAKVLKQRYFHIYEKEDKI